MKRVFELKKKTSQHWFVMELTLILKLFSVLIVGKLGLHPKVLNPMIIPLPRKKQPDQKKIEIENRK